MSKSRIAILLLSSIVCLSSSAIADSGCAGVDSTALVQAAISNSTCLPDGVYLIDMPKLGPTGRRHDEALHGPGVLSGCRPDSAIIRFRGDPTGLLWYGTYDVTIRSVVLDATCLTGSIVEQTHLARFSTVPPVVTDSVLMTGPVGGDCINVVGPVASPLSGMDISHNQIGPCARFGVQLTRSIHGGRVANNRFEDSAIGSEGGGDLDGIGISDNVFSSPPERRGMSLEIERMSHLTVDHNVMDRSMFVFICNDCDFTRNRVTLNAPVAGDQGNAIHLADIAHRVTIRGNVLTQSTSGAYPAILVGPLRTNRQADLSDIAIGGSGPGDGNVIVQEGAANGVVATGVSGVFSVVNNAMTYVGTSTFTARGVVTGPSVASPPAVSVPMGAVVVQGNALSGFVP